MSDITLSAGVRQNLLSLQSTNSLLSTTQQDLATGKKVNSAQDNPTNFFTSQSLNNRASDLGSLARLSIGQAVQTLNAANQGITSLTSLVQSAKSIATQAEQAATGTVNFSQITGSVAVAADTTQISSTGTVASAVGGVVATTQSSATLSATGLTNLNNNDTLTFKLGTAGSTFTATFTVTTGASAGAGTFTTAAQLQGILSTDFGSNASVTAPTSGSNNGGVVLTATDLTDKFTIGGTNNAGSSNFTAAAENTGDTLTLADGNGHTSTFFYVTANASAANGTFTSAADLASAVSNSASAVHGSITPTAPTSGPNSGGIQFASSGAITTGGNISTALGFGSSAGTTVNGNFNATLATLTGNLTLQVGSDAASTLTFGQNFGQIHTRAALVSAFSSYTDASVSIDSANNIQITPTSTDTVSIGGTPGTVTSLGLQVGTNTPTATVVSANATRSSLQSQYNDLLTQIDQLAGDSSYNGINLLGGNNLKVTFNENGTSSLTIQGVNFNATGLGLSSVTGNGFQDNHNIETTLSGLDTALTSLRSQAAQFGSNLSIVQTRQDFTKDLINTLQTGADNLVLADTNQEGANLLALQTRQQLSITSLSLASQADQAILKIL